MQRPLDVRCQHQQQVACRLAPYLAVMYDCGVQLRTAILLDNPKSLSDGDSYYDSPYYSERSVGAAPLPAVVRNATILWRQTSEWCNR